MDRHIVRKKEVHLFLFCVTTQRKYHFMFKTRADIRGYVIMYNIDSYKKSTTDLKLATKCQIKTKTKLEGIHRTQTSANQL